MKLWMPADEGLLAARVMLLAVIVSMLLSTSVSVLIEGLTYLAFMVNPTLRRRLVDVLFRHPLVLAAYPFGIALLVGMLHGSAPWMEALKGLLAWRRMLLLPLALAVFTDAPSRRLVLRVVVATCFLGAVLSFVTDARSISLTARLDPGIVFQNYATQGMVMSVAIIICIAALLRPADFSGDRLLANRWVTAGVLAVLVVDVVFVLWSRTGYLSAFVMAVAVAILLAPGTWRLKLVTGCVILIACIALMVASPHVHDRLAQARDQIATVDQASEGTPIGTRIVMWRNTWRMIFDHPLLGVGTGGFQSGYAPYVQGVAGWRGQLTDDPHNQYLKLQGEMGLLGLGTFVFWLIAVFRHPAPTPWRELASAALIGWCVTSLANSDFSTQVESRMIYFWLGAMLGGPLFTRPPAKDPSVTSTEPPPSRRVV
ncbi:MAG TPA: O-antigen ligase family protein [Xanthobacteraceae bacterium]|nr:O-antigen ligase family protein [Xanthobacteraceae bacterium]